MATELLAVQEEYLDDFIFVLRCGIEYSQKIGLDFTIPKRDISPYLLEFLSKWCDEEEIYLSSMKNIE